jgi:hypothetical protein
MTTDNCGVSALLLQRQFALRRYETAWMMLHKFRRAMVNVARQPLQGEVELMIRGLGVVRLVYGEVGNRKAGRRHS